jgi:hypothetical protein
MKYQSIYLILLLWGLNVHSQQINYQPLRCQGTIPKDFLSLTSKKIEADYTKISKSNKSKRVKTTEKEFAFNANFSIDNILFSGKILYGDVLTDYVNKVANTIINGDPSLTGKLRFYVLKSSSVNAFATDQGIVFVTVGLLSQVENEAQLAYILCHEISHYKSKHSIQKYKRQKDISKGKGDFKNLDLESKLKATYHYSKEDELEADKDGFELFSKTKYAQNEAITSFDMLLFSYLPYDEIDWSTTIFEDSLFKLDYTAPKIESRITAEEDEDDEESSHPNIKKRKAELESFYAKAKNSNNTLYMFGEDYFKKIQQQARVELFFINLNYGNYQRVYYLAYLYKKKYKDTTFANRMSAMAIYGQTNKRIFDEPTTYSKEKSIEKLEGVTQKVNAFLTYVDLNTLSIINVRNAWNSYQSNKSDSFSKYLFEQSLYLMFKQTQSTPSSFTAHIIKDSTTLNIEKKLDIDENITLEELKLKPEFEALSKTEKMKIIKAYQDKNKKPESAPSEFKSTSTSSSNKLSSSNILGFSKLLSDSLFVKSLREQFSLYNSKNDNDEKSNNLSKRKDPKSNWYIKRFGETGGIKKLVLLNPNYDKYTFNSGEPKENLLENEKTSIELAKLYKEMAKLNGIDVDFIDISAKKQLTTETMNQYSELMEWVTEWINNNDGQNVLYNTNHISLIDEKFGTNNIMLSGITQKIYKEPIQIEYLIGSIIVYPLLLPYIVSVLPEYNLQLSSIIFDIKTGKVIYVQRDNYKVKKRTDHVKTMIYSLFHQIKS